MPIKNFFSGRKPEENNAVPAKPVNGSAFEDNFEETQPEDFSAGDFGGMQSLDMYADEDSAAGGFAALLQPEEEGALQETQDVFYGDEALFLEEEENGQNVGEAVFQNLFADQPGTGADDFFAPQPDDAQGEDDFFAPQPSDYEDAATHGDDFFATQPLDFSSEAQQSSADSFAQETQAELPFADATYTMPAASSVPEPEVFSLPQEEMVQPLPDNTFVQAAPIFSLETMEEGMLPVEPDFTVPFDIAVPEQTPSLTMDLEEETSEDLDTEYMPKKKYTPVFTQPIPSALDELRAGIVKPASPISSIAATQIPVVVTAAEAAAAEAAAKVAVEEAAFKAAEEEAAAREEVERVAVQAQAEQYGYAEPSQQEMGFGYAPPMQETPSLHDTYHNTYGGALSPEEFSLPITEDVPAWEETAPFASAPGFEHEADNQLSAPEESQHVPFFDYDNAPIENSAVHTEVSEQSAPQASFEHEIEPLQDSFEVDRQDYPAAQSPEDYANNLQAMFNNDGTYAAVDAMEQPLDDAGIEPDSFAMPLLENQDTPEFEKSDVEEDFSLENMDFAPVDFDTKELDAELDATPFAAFEETEDGAMGEFNFDPTPDEAFSPFESDGVADDHEFALPKVEDEGFALPEEENEPIENAPAFNPFQSEEWLDDEEEPASAKKKANLSFSEEDNSQRVRVKKKKSGGSGNGGGGGQKNNMPLFIVLGVLLVAILAVAGYLLLNGKDNPTQASSSGAPPVAVSSTPPVSSSSEVVSSVPQVDPIPRDEWYMQLVNRQNVLTSDFKVDVKNCSDGIPVDARVVDALNQMIKDGNATGLKLVVTGGYRTYERQKTNYESQVRQQVAAGKSQADAEAAAAIITAPPGASEHNTGLSVDIMSQSFKKYEAAYEETAEAKWLLENAANYGFILRYAKTTQNITGFEYEPWHYRYVGVDQAKKIKASGLTLEEYLAQDVPTGIPTAGTEGAADSAATSESDATASSSSAASSSSSAAQ